MMYKSIIELLENTAKKFPNKNVFESQKESITYNLFLENCKKNATYQKKL